MQEKFIQTIANTSLWASIIACLVIISLGYILAKVGVLKKEWKKPLIETCMTVGVWSLTLISFMTTTTIKQLQEQAIVLGLAFVFYSGLCLIAWLWVKYFPFKVPTSVQKANDSTTIGILSNTETLEEKRNNALVIWMLLIFGSTTFFGLPIVQQLYEGDGGLLSVNIWTIPYRIFGYTFLMMQMLGIKFDKKNAKKSFRNIILNPVILLIIIGLLCWLSQLIPGAGISTKNLDAPVKLKLENGSYLISYQYQTFGPNFSRIYLVDNNNNFNKYIYDIAKKVYICTNINAVGWFEWKITIPYFYKPINIMASLCSPLIWIAIGMTLSESSFREATKDKWVWIYALFKMVIIPIIIYLIFLALFKQNLVTKNVAIAMVIICATPPGTLVVAFAISGNKGVKISASTSAICTILAIVAIPIWILICEMTM